MTVRAGEYIVGEQSPLPSGYRLVGVACYVSEDAPNGVPGSRGDTDRGLHGPNSANVTIERR